MSDQTGHQTKIGIQSPEVTHFFISHSFVTAPNLLFAVPLSVSSP